MNAERKERGREEGRKEGRKDGWLDGRIISGRRGWSEREKGYDICVYVSVCCGVRVRAIYDTGSIFQFRDARFY